jgi:ABC-type glycerol-3-phosphate transport system substrate-binding protein
MAIPARAHLTRRRLLVHGAHVTLVVAGPALAACGTLPQPESRAATPPAGKAPVALLHWNGWNADHRFSLATKTVFDDFQAKHPGRVTLEIGEGGAGQGDVKIKTALAAGTQPHTWFHAQILAADLFALGGTVDVNAELRTNKDWGKLKGELIPNLVEGCTWKGKLTLLPMFDDAHGCGYNKHLLVQAGLSFPRTGYTWEEFVEIGRKVAEPPDRVLFSVGYDWNYFGWWMGANGQRFLSPDRTKIVLDTPPVLEALQWFHEHVTRAQLARNGPSNFNTGGALTEIINAGAVTPPRYPNVDPGDGSGIQVTHYPLGPSNSKKEPFTPGNLFGLLVFKGHDPATVAAALEVAMWSARPEVQILVTQASGHAPANLTAAKDPGIARALRDNPILKALNDLARYNVPTPNFPSWTMASEILTGNMQRLARGELLPKDVLADAQPKMQALLDEDLRRG